MKNILLINSLLNVQAKKSFQNNHYGARHASSFNSSTIGKMILAVAQYADDHKKRFDCPINEDYVLGPEILAMLKSIRGLLNGEIGGLDGGFTDEIILAISKNCGFKEEDF